jgi:hypothetical protein
MIFNLCNTYITKWLDMIIPCLWTMRKVWSNLSYHQWLIYKLKIWLEESSSDGWRQEMWVKGLGVKSNSNVY